VLRFDGRTGSGCDGEHYARRVKRRSSQPVVLRSDLEIGDPVGVVLGFLERGWFYEVADDGSFGEREVRRANRGGARISAEEMASIVGRRRAIERALRAIAPAASLVEAVSVVPWLPLRQLFDSFAEIRGVGFSKMTKALHPKRPALIPMLDSVVRTYLQEDDPGAPAPFGERALALVRGYKRDLDRNRKAMRAVRHEVACRGYAVSEVRILDLLIWSAVNAG
jgi:Family of unknown function (DUF6308)